MTARTREMKLQAEGIVCGGCAEDMERLLAKEKGIIEAAVDYGTGRVQVKYDEDLIAGKEVFEKVLRLAYPVKIVAHD